MISQAGFLITGLISLAFAYGLFNRVTRPSLSKIRGPKSSSFFLGHMLELFRHPVGRADFEWQRLYGDVVRLKTVFGEDQLFVADPKALQKIVHTSSYDYPKQHNLRVLTRMINGHGILWADGEIHKRHRKILLPGFGGPESKAFLSISIGCVESMCSKWMEIIGSSSDQKVVLNVSASLSRAALDVIGEAAFDVRFDTIHNDDHPLATKYHNILSDVLGRPSVQQVFIQAASKHVPSWILEWVTDHGSHARLQRAREAKNAAAEAAKELVQEKAESLLAGNGSRDIFSLLVKANMNPVAKDKLTEEEVLSQMRTVMFAGHETTSNSLSWILLEIARHPKVQSRLRAEIRAKEAAMRARGDTEFTQTDLDAMPYTTAVIKEGLRYHPVQAQIHRIAGKEDIVPLSRPIALESGELIDELVVPKGTPIVVSIAAYNRNAELWGEDAHEFNPDRWLGGAASAKKNVSIGVYSNLMTFIGGPRGCMGWRFATLEIQSFVVGIIGKFEIAMTERAEKIVRSPCDLMIPMVEGELERGCQVPLVVSVARDDV